MRIKTKGSSGDKVGGRAVVYERRVAGEEHPRRVYGGDHDGV